MPEPLTQEFEEKFISNFGPPRFARHNDHRPAARALLIALKRVSATLPVRLDASNNQDGEDIHYPRIHGRLLVAGEPILWCLCAPCNDLRRKPAHYKVEILAGRTTELRAARVFRRVEEIAKGVGARLGDGKESPILRIGIVPAITEPHADRIAQAIADIARVVLPVYQ